MQPMAAVVDTHARHREARGHAPHRLGPFQHDDGTPSAGGPPGGHEPAGPAPSTIRSADVDTSRPYGER